MSTGRVGLGELCESLESRQLLAPTISNLTSTPSNIASEGLNLRLSVSASAPTFEHVRAVTFFRDMNGDHHWTPGTDVDLGARYTPTGNHYELTVVPGPSWPTNTEICADAVDDNGNWTGSGPTFLSLHINRAPVVTDFRAVSDTATFEAGRSGTMYGHIFDDVHNESFRLFWDVNANDRYDPDVDDTFLFLDGDSDFNTNFEIGANWPGNARIGCTAVDGNGAWSLSPFMITIPVDHNPDPPPYINNTYFQNEDMREQSGRPKSPLAHARFDDAIGISATTYFIDLDNNGGWTPTVDVSLETFFAGGVQTLERAPAFEPDSFGRESIEVYADAVDTTGHWRGATRVGTYHQPPAAQITSMRVEPTGPGDIRITADATSPAYFGHAAGTVNYVAFFLDLNYNNVYDTGTDTPLGTQSVFTTISNGDRRFVKDVHFDTIVDPHAPIAAVVTNGGPLPYSRSPVRVSPPRGPFTQIPTVDSIVTEVGINPANGATTFATPGTAVRVTANWSAPLGGRVITFFFDRNNNGLWDPAIDYDLGFRNISGTSGTVTFTSAALPTSVVGYGSIAAAVQDASGRGADSWGPTRTDSYRQIRTAPTPVLFGAVPTTAALNSTIIFRTNISDDYAVRAATAFLDVNGNGFDGADRSITIFNRINGTPKNGKWEYSMNLTGIAAGTYRIYIAAVDFYQGHSSQPGGVTNGLWSSRISFTVTIA